MSDDRDIIEVEDYRVVEVREEPLPDTDEPPPGPVPAQQWSGRVYTTSVSGGGGGCCLGLSATLLLIGVVFVLGVCALIYLIAQLIGWAIPGL